MDAGCTPERVGQVHVSDQPTDLQRHPRSPAAPPRFPTPKGSKSSPVPTNRGLGPDDGQRIYCARNEAIKTNEHHSVETAKSQSLRGFAPQHIDLLPENQNLRLKPRSRAKQASERRPQQRENIEDCPLERSGWESEFRTSGEQLSRAKQGARRPPTLRTYSRQFLVGACCFENCLNG